MGSRKSHKRLLYLIISLIILIALAVAGFLIYRHHKSTKNTSAKSTSSISKTPLQTANLAAAEAGLLPYTLNNPLSRMSVFPTSTNSVMIAGGYNTNGSTSSNITSLNLTTGSQTSLGNLTVPSHDASYSLINNTPFIIGGGNSNSISQVQSIANNTSTVSTNLSALRSDSSAITINNVTYVIGGYNGSSADSNILTTTDGKTFTNFATLSTPVRYAAVTSFGSDIYVFGGTAVTGPNAGQPLNIVQVIDTVSHKVSVLNTTMPQSLSGAIAVNLNNEIFLAGGQSSTVQTYQTGIGTTQVANVSLANSKTSQIIYTFNPNNNTFLNAGVLQLPIANAGVTIINNRAWIIGGESNNQVTNVIQMITPNSGFGISGTTGAGSPYYGEKLMIADRGNNRIIILNPSMNITWQYPSPGMPTPPFKLYFPDDAFFSNNGTAIISNQEDNNTIVKIAYPSGKTLWTFGHPLQAGSAYGYLRAPDDAYQLQNGQVMVADDQNCRVLFINPNGTVASQIGTTGVCRHNPPYSIGSPNGDTPLYDGNVLISEIIGSWVSEYTPQGKLVWTTHLPISYPSDPQQIGASKTNNNDLYLIADYANPGAILTFNREGQVLSRYQPTSGPGMLNSPSLVEMLPSGVYMANDDHRDRMVAIDPATGALVWQYGTTDTPGNSLGQLNRVDGFDILGPNGTTPTHGASG